MHNERYYEQVAEELRLFGPKTGLWAKSFAEANGDNTKAKALYLRYRAAQIECQAKEELELVNQAKEEQQRAKWQQNEEKRKSAAKSEGITPIHIVLAGLLLLMLILFLIQ